MAENYHETQHSMKRRSPWHDYSRKGIYMITLAVDGRVPLLGRLTGDADIPLGSANAPRIVLSPLGEAIVRDEVKKIHQHFPMVDVWKICIMPDHIHMIVRVNDDMPKGKSLGSAINGFKAGCSKAWWRLTASSPAPAAGSRSEAGPHFDADASKTSPATANGPSAHSATAAALTAPSAPSPAAGPSGRGSLAATVFEASASNASKVSKVPPHAAKRPPLFEPGYNDKILLDDGQLERWSHYLIDNPRRLLLKRQHPDLFHVLHDVSIAGRSCQIIGNRFLLDIPDKMAVIVHRRYTDADNESLRSQWLACGERGGVLVSAAISPKEKAVLREAMNRGYRIILLRENGFPKLYKPSGEAFDACTSGRLLQISPWEYHMEHKVITREQCLTLNALAEHIAKP